MRHRTIPTLLFTFAVTAALCVAAGAASAAPTGAKNAFMGEAQCGADHFTFVVNNANGQGQGTENNGNQALFAPAHLIETHQVFHPTAFDLVFTFTGTDGATQSFTNTASRPHQTGSTMCDISGSQSVPGGTVSLSGTVQGWIS